MKRFWRWILLEPAPEEVAARQEWAEAMASVRRAYVAGAGLTEDQRDGRATTYVGRYAVHNRP